MNKQPEQNWNNATWLGSRRIMIKQALKLSVRQRLEALEEINKTSYTLANLRKKTPSDGTATSQE